MDRSKIISLDSDICALPRTCEPFSRNELLFQGTAEKLTKPANFASNLMERHDWLPSTLILTVYIQFPLVISLFAVNSPAMGCASADHGHIGISGVSA
jgi:hypothetical protein